MKWRDYFPDLSISEPLRVTGIDLGTTKSIIAEAVLEPESGMNPQVQCIPITQLTGEPEPHTSIIVPSCIALQDSTRFIGEGARSMFTRPSNTSIFHLKNAFYECKNDMGLKKTYSLAPDRKGVG